MGRRIRLDLYYVENWSITGDVAIVWAHTARGRGTRKRCTIVPGLIAHEWIARNGGSERVLDAMADAFPDAPVKVLWSDAEAGYLEGTPIGKLDRSYAPAESQACGASVDAPHLATSPALRQGGLDAGELTPLRASRPRTLAA